MVLHLAENFPSNLNNQYNEGSLWIPQIVISAC
jgi:hypothetical protein